jgi:iron complex transport system permease protein
MGLALTIGPAKLPLGQVPGMIASRLFPFEAAPSWTGADELILFEIRLPRIILAVLVGGALATAGTVFQGLFRNPMADPYVIGISAGAALGATIAHICHLSVPLMAFTWGLGTTLLVYQLARVGSKTAGTVLLLAGIVVGAFMSAINSFLMVMNREEISQITIWLMGGLSSRSWSHVHGALIYFLLGFGLVAFFARDLNVMSLGEDRAYELGIELEQVQRILVAGASLLTAAAVSVSGIIGFVGLIVPHTVRLFIGPDHRWLLPASCLGGGLFLLIADTLARTLLDPMELPVGIITSMAGAPFFLHLLLKKKQSPM